MRRAILHRNHGDARDDGNALVEFLGAAMILMIPALYLVLTLGRVQAAVLATEAAAKDSGRAMAIADTYDAGMARAEGVTALALADQGFHAIDPARTLRIDCSATVCLAPGSTVTTTVRLDVGLPGIGGDTFVIPVTATVVTPVDEYKEWPP